MRARNPCVLARFKLLGWNVRFIANASTLQFVGFNKARQCTGSGPPRQYLIEPDTQISDILAARNRYSANSAQIFGLFGYRLFARAVDKYNITL